MFFIFYFKNFFIFYFYKCCEIYYENVSKNFFIFTSFVKIYYEINRNNTEYFFFDIVNKITSCKGIENNFIL